MWTIQPSSGSDKHDERLQLRAEVRRPKLSKSDLLDCMRYSVTHTIVESKRMVPFNPAETDFDYDVQFGFVSA